MKEIKGILYMQRDEIIVYLMLETGFFLFGEILLWVIVYVAGEKESILPLGTLVALCMSGFILAFGSGASIPTCFNTAVGMGAARKRSVPVIFGAYLVMDLIVAWAACLFYHLERWIFRLAYAGMPLEQDFGYIFRWKYLLPACLAMVAWNALVGAIFLKIGKVVFVFVYILWMVVCIGVPRLEALIQSTQDNVFLRLCRATVDWVAGCSQAGILAAVVTASAVCMFFAWMLLRRQQVVS